jgi:hypothetical protein
MSMQTESKDKPCYCSRKLKAIVSYNSRNIGNAITKYIIKSYSSVG